MNIEKAKELGEKVNKVFSPSLKRPLSDTEISEALFNLSGFAQILLKMRMEVVKSGE